MTAVLRTRAELREALAGAPRPVGLVPTMGWLHDGHRSLIAAGPRRDATTVVDDLRQPAPVQRRRRPEPLPAQRGPRRRHLRGGGRRPRLRAAGRGGLPARLRHGRVGRARSPGRSRARRDPATSTASRRWSRSCSTWSAPSAPTSARRTPSRSMVIRRMARDLAPADGGHRLPHRPRARRPGAVVTQRPPRRPGARRGAGAPPGVAGRPGRLGGRRTVGRRAPRPMRDVLAGEPLAEVDYVSVADARRSPSSTRSTLRRSLSLAVRFGATRLIDNEPLQ